MKVTCSPYYVSNYLYIFSNRLVSFTFKYLVTLNYFCQFILSIEEETKSEADTIHASSVKLARRYDALRAKCWASLEETVVFRNMKPDKHSLASFKPSIQLFSSKTNNNFKPIAVVGG